MVVIFRQTFEMIMNIKNFSYEITYKRGNKK